MSVIVPTHSFGRISSLVDKSCDPIDGELWHGLREILKALAHGDTRLGLPALGGIFEQSEHSLLEQGTLPNRTLLEVARLLTFVRVKDVDKKVNWAAVGGAELGSIYEQLLELVPEIDGATFEFRIQGVTTGTTTRRSSGSYYTPPELVDVVMNNASDRRIGECLTRDGDRASESLLALRVVDPACGCGHFLLAAARRIASYLEPHLPESNAPRHTEALRLVIANCIYGVDLNPMAIELCKVNLWLDAAEPGRALSFLDEHLQQGNALIGAPPDAATSGIPHRAWRASDKPRRPSLKPSDRKPEVTQVPANAAQLSLVQNQALADLWCAAFFWPVGTNTESNPGALLDAWELLLQGDTTPEPTLHVVRQLARDHGFFHWHLRFPEVFSAGGFDVVLGNPRGLPTQDGRRNR